MERIRYELGLSGCGTDRLVSADLNGDGVAAIPLRGTLVVSADTRRRINREWHHFIVSRYIANRPAFDSLNHGADVHTIQCSAPRREPQVKIIVTSGAGFIVDRVPVLVIIGPVVHEDERGSFTEMHSRDGCARVELPAGLVQDNLSLSKTGLLPGFHLQHADGQGKHRSALSNRTLFSYK